LVHEREQLARERQQGVELREKLENLYRQSAQLELARAGSQASKYQTVSLALTPVARNFDNPDRAVLSARTSLVKLRLELERQEAANLRSYRAVVKTADGDREIWTQDGIKPRGRKSSQYVVVRVPADRFKASGKRDFSLTLYALTAGGKDYEEFEFYSFQVIANRR
jgi:hypothetical protein